MSLFVLDLERLRSAVEHGVARLPEYSDVWEGRVLWRICPECLWLTVSYDAQLKCGRKPQDPVMYGAMWDHAACSQDRPLAHVPQPIADALWASLRLGGVNAVVELTLTLKPEDMGLLSGVEKYRERRGRIPTR